MIDLATLRLLASKPQWRQVYVQELVHAAPDLFDELERLRLERESATQTARNCLVTVAAAKDRLSAEDKLREMVARLEYREVTEP